MSYIPNEDFLIEVQKGKIAGHSLVHKFGRNDAVPSGTWEAIANLSTAAAFLAAATTVRVKAGNAADDTAGAGAREITVVGLDGSGNEQTEALATAGASASSNSSTSFFRVYRAYVSAAGTYATPVNTAAVIIENSAGTVDLIQINIAEGQSQFAMYSVPLGKTAYVVRVSMTADAAKAADFRMFKRLDILDTTAPLGAQRIMLHFDGVLGHITHQIAGAIDAVPALSDIWMEAEGGGGVSEVSADFEILLVDD